MKLKDEKKILSIFSSILGNDQKFKSIKEFVNSFSSIEPNSKKMALSLDYQKKLKFEILDILSLKIDIGSKEVSNILHFFFKKIAASDYICDFEYEFILDVFKLLFILRKNCNKYIKDNFFSSRKQH